jgi:hypothetical protein
MGSMVSAIVSTHSTKASKGVIVGFWISTVLFAMQMSFTVYAQLKMPQVAQEFARLGFPGYFRVELSWMKVAGLLALLVPMVPAWLKEWAYAGFAITLVSAVIAHVSVGEGPEASIWAIGTAVVWCVSYFFWRRLQVSTAAI